MTHVGENTPVIIGVGQFSERLGDADYRGLSPMDLAGRSLELAIADCRATSAVAPTIDTIAAIPQFEISTPVSQAPFGKSSNPPRSIAARVGANPDRAILEVVGGQGPQKLIGELAQDIAQGKSECAAIVGSEAISTMLALLKTGDHPDWSEDMDGQFEPRGFGMSGMIEKTAIANGFGGTIPSYALFENARRAKLGFTLEAYRAKIGELFAPFTCVAAANPDAAAPLRRTAKELANVSEHNRIVAEPYTRMTVARDQVNQAAAIIIASARQARALGIPEDGWVHIHAVADAKELSVLSRPDLGHSAASVASVRSALDIAGIAIKDIGHIDLYSCFAIAVFNQIDALGLAHDDPRGLTLTGGLPFFGGAGNNYSAHAIAEAVTRVRTDRHGYALVGANGGFMSKYSTGIYSCRPADWSESRWNKLPDQDNAVGVRETYEGGAVLESFTIMPGKTGTSASVAARLPDGARAVAMVDKGDRKTLAAMQDREPVGRNIIIAIGENGRNSFRFADDV